MKLELRSLTDQELVRVCVERGRVDDRPFAELFRRYHRLVWSVCHTWFRNEQDADDLTQDTFLKAFRSLDSFEGRSSLSSWLFRVATNACHNERRRRSRRPLGFEDARPVEEHPLVSGESPEGEVLLHDDLARLERAMERLTPDEWEILRLTEYVGAPHRTIAQRLGLSLSAVKMRALRARAALRREYLQEDQPQ